MKNIIVAGALALAATSVSATTIDFESLEQMNSSNNVVGSTYTEAGFTFATGVNDQYDLRSFGTGESRFTGSTALFNDTINGTITLTQDSGDAFDLTSITLSELSGNGTANVVFDGILAGGGVVSQMFNLDGIFGNEVFAFNNLFTDLLSVTWTQSSNFHQFDDVVVNGSDMPAVPLPAGGLLLISAFGGLAFVRRRQAA